MFLSLFLSDRRYLEVTFGIRIIQDMRTGQTQYVRGGKRIRNSKTRGTRRPGHLFFFLLLEESPPTTVVNTSQATEVDKTSVRSLEACVEQKSIDELVTAMESNE